MRQSDSQFTIRLPRPHAKQRDFIDSPAKRRIVRAGRRGGKTYGVAIYAAKSFLAKRRVLYATPTQDQLDSFWYLIKQIFREPIEAGVLYKNETRHLIEVPNTENRLRAKTAWNADTLRGDYADDLILDEFQLMNEDTWDKVGAPMLLDTDGNAILIYTPPSLHSRSVSKARDPQHAAKRFNAARQDDTGRWATFHFSSHENPHISQGALDEIAKDMTAISYRMEILAEDVDEAPGALWTRAIIDAGRVMKIPDLSRVVVALDPSATTTGDEAGIIVAGCADEHLYILADETLQGSPLAWATAAVRAYYRHQADNIIAEANQGGEMVSLVIKQVDENVPVKLIYASRGKQTRAEPVAAVYEQGRAHHQGCFPALEDELCIWLPGDASPNRLDALVWAGTELMLNERGVFLA